MPAKGGAGAIIMCIQVRDHMSTDQLALLACLESRDCTLLDLDTPTPTRKTKLTELAQRWLVQRIEVNHA